MGKPGEDSFSSSVPACRQSCSLMGPGHVCLVSLPTAARRMKPVGTCGHRPLLYGWPACCLAPTATQYGLGVLESCVGTWALSCHVHAISLTPSPLGMGSCHGPGQPTGSLATHRVASPPVPVALAGGPS